MYAAASAAVGPFAIQVYNYHSWQQSICLQSLFAPSIPVFIGLMGGRGLSAGCSICAWIARQIDCWLNCPLITAGSCCFLQHKFTVAELRNLALVWLIDVVLVVFTVVACCCASKRTYVPYYIGCLVVSKIQRLSRRTTNSDFRDHQVCLIHVLMTSWSWSSELWSSRRMLAVAAQIWWWFDQADRRCLEIGWCSISLTRDFFRPNFSCLACDLAKVLTHVCVPVAPI